MLDMAPTSGAPASSREGVNEAFFRVRDAQRRSPVPSYQERLDHLGALEDVLLRRKDDIVATISRDFGNRSRHESTIVEVYFVVNAIRHVREHLEEWMQSEPRRVNWPFLPARAEVRYQPLGVVGIVAPWNYPVHLALNPLVGALAAGNRALIKPSEFAPETATLLEDIVKATFATDHVVVVNGGSDVGSAFARLPFDHLVFTGSTKVGKLVMKAAADNLTPLTLELGGKSPCIVGDFPIHVAAERIITGKLFNGGQTCVAPDYALVPRGQVDAFVRAAKEVVAKRYPRFDGNPDFTRVVNEAHYDRLQRYLDEARERGAEVVPLSGEASSRANRTLVPSIVLKPTDEMKLMEEEIFGPILPVLPHEGIEDAIAYVNARPRPLAIYTFSYDDKEIERIISNTMSGGITVNETMLHFAQDELPAGGVGASGMGQYHGREGFEAMSKKRSIFRQARLNATDLLRPPYSKILDTLLKVVLSR